MGKLTETSKDIGITLTKFEVKILKKKRYSELTFMHNILAKYWQNSIFMTTFCQVFSSTLLLYRQKQYNTKKQKKKWAYLENCTSDLLLTKTIGFFFFLIRISVFSLSY